LVVFRSTWLTLLLGVLVGLGLALSVPAFTGSVGDRTPRQRPAAPSLAPSMAPSLAWTPQIAFQYYETAGIDAQFLAEHVDWLMLRHGAEGLRDEVRERGYGGPLPQYVLLFQIIGPGPYRNSREGCKDAYTPLQNNVMWTRDFCALAHPHEDWFLHNGKGERLYTKERLWDGSRAYQYLMDPGSAGFRAFWVAQLRRQQDAGWESLFLDNVAASYERITGRADNADGTVAEYANAEQWQGAVVGMLRAIRAGFPARPLWGNIIEAPPTAEAWDRYRPELDGIQEEHFAAGWPNEAPLDPAAWLAMIERAERTLLDGKGVVLYTQGEQSDFAHVRFGLASYLLVATPDTRASFRYTHTSSYAQLWWYPEYDLNLGAPRGPRYREGSQWARDFACARVTVDPARRSATIERLPCRQQERGER
jgi:hypothetical protein